jgi:hypothetical protein
VIEAAADADAEVQPRRDRLAGQADLLLDRQPAVIDHLASRADHPAERPGQRFDGR